MLAPRFPLKASIEHIFSENVQDKGHYSIIMRFTFLTLDTVEYRTDTVITLLIRCIA